MSEPLPSPSLYERYLPWRPWVEIGFWVTMTVLSAAGNTVTVGMDLRRLGLPHEPWQPAVWEWSSNLMLLALVPLVAWFSRRFPLHLDTWRRSLPLYLPASLAYSLLHVLGMVALRELAYALAGLSYDFGDWWRQLRYEYIKDVRSFINVVLAIAVYRFLLLRLQGEASLLDAPDDAPPVEPVERPERFLVRKLGREFLVAAADIERLSAAGNYVNLHVRGRDYPLRSTIATIETRLDPLRFQRVHRSHIVNLDHVAMIEPLDSGDARLHLKDGSTLPCSRRYRSTLRERSGNAA
ncbi:MAG TPA: LytTR family DNA-binding domain-containing protein [Arenimonas sp.]|nr:LytTR family DNA-binding domain-containing protein [Arenimonas sp.]